MKLGKLPSGHRAVDWRRDGSFPIPEGAQQTYGLTDEDFDIAEKSFVFSAYVKMKGLSVRASDCQEHFASRVQQTVLPATLNPVSSEKAVSGQVRVNMPESEGEILSASQVSLDLAGHENTQGLCDSVDHPKPLELAG